MKINRLMTEEGAARQGCGSEAASCDYVNHTQRVPPTPPLHMSMSKGRSCVGTLYYIVLDGMVDGGDGGVVWTTKDAAAAAVGEPIRKWLRNVFASLFCALFLFSCCFLRNIYLACGLELNFQHCCFIFLRFFLSLFFFDNFGSRLLSHLLLLSRCAIRS